MTEPTGPLLTGPITDLDGLRRLERRVRRSLGLKSAGRRWLDSLPAIVQVVVAALASYAIAHYALGHENPVLAVTVTITSLGLNRDARPVRVLQSVCAILLGVALATVVVELWGQGIWQLAVVLVVVMSAARLVVKSPAFPVAAATPAALTTILPAPVQGPYAKVLDAVIAAAIALLVTVLIPRSTRRIAAADGRVVFARVTEAIDGVADGLRDGNAAAGELALSRLRRAQPLLDGWGQSLDTARSVARISPWLRRQLPELARGQAALDACELAIRHLRLIARRAEFMARDGARHEALGGLVAEVGRAVELLGREQEEPALAGRARELLEGIAARLHPASLGEAGPAASALVLQLRPLVVDLLVATGLALPEAQGRLAAL